jgi:hypothetical protein
MWMGNMIGGFVAQTYTVNGVAQWPKIWAIPAIEAAVCLVVFLGIWKGKTTSHGPSVESDMTMK